MVLEGSAMTANQLIAMGFPLLAAAVVGITGLCIRRPWAEAPLETATIPAVSAERSDSDIQEIAEIEVSVVSAKEAAQIQRELLDEAERLITSAQRQIQRARTPAAKIISTN
jgi:hypothetical protein